MTSSLPAPDVPPPLRSNNCVFTDLDGTLVELRLDPAPVRCDPSLLTLLRGCAERLGGALAVVSGRPIAELDFCLAPERFAVAGIHGLEVRARYGETMTSGPGAEILEPALHHVSAALKDSPMLYLENKGAGLAVHWRRAPELAPLVTGLLASELKPGLRLQEGNCVTELLPASASKGAAVRAFMQEEPFAGRLPVFIGDDLTDLEGFDAVRSLGGYGIAVGERIDADYRLASPQAVSAWLAGEFHA